jgi:hypothetical protein
LVDGGAAAMGIGIWSMHYIGMLAYSLPVPVLYHWPTVLLSLLAAMLASAVALLVVSRDEMGPLRTVFGGLLMGSGIAAMHYVGMHAMRLPAMCSYSHGLWRCQWSWQSGFPWSPYVNLPLAGRHQLHELAKACQRNADGRRYPGHALHRHGRGQF